MDERGPALNSVTRVATLSVDEGKGALGGIRFAPGEQVPTPLWYRHRFLLLSPPHENERVQHPKNVLLESREPSDPLNLSRAIEK